MSSAELKPKAAEPDAPVASNESVTHKKRLWPYALVLLTFVAGLVLTGIRSRLKAEEVQRSVAEQSAITAVSVVQPKRIMSEQQVTLPGSVEPFISSPIYARTDGYLRKWYFDIGAHVKKGNLLVIIETPEIDQQLEQARSNLATAEANLELSRVTTDRYEALLKKHAVSQQDADNAKAAYQANQSIVNADKANVQRFETLVSFEKVYAPFDGFITARHTDIGDLISAGSSTAPRTQLFDIAQVGTLRVYVNVPEEYSHHVAPGKTEAEIVLPGFSGQTFPGQLVRTAKAINMSTRTLLVEIDVDNAAGRLFSGSYAEVHLRIPSNESTFVIPTNCLIFKSQGLQVALVRDGKVLLADLVPGHDHGTEIEVESGLGDGDQVIINPSDSVTSGQSVRIVQAVLPGDRK
jgi:RND family efflux transporter MFP subunit